MKIGDWVQGRGSSGKVTEIMHEGTVVFTDDFTGLIVRLSPEAINLVVTPEEMADEKL